MSTSVIEGRPTAKTLKSPGSAVPVLVLQQWHRQSNDCADKIHVSCDNTYEEAKKSLRYKLQGESLEVLCHGKVS